MIAIGKVKVGTFAILATMLVAAFGCAGSPGEGDRCNPYLTVNSSDECTGGTVCVGLGTPYNTVAGSAGGAYNCQENYCCKVDSNGDITSTIAACQVGCDPCAYAASYINPPPGCPGGPPLPDAGTD
jgi:hypothetical protein